MEGKVAKYTGWKEFLGEIKWKVVFAMIFLHLGALYGVYSIIISGKWQSIIFAYILAVSLGVGTLAGAHRYFSHRSFKAKWQLRTLLMILQTMAGQKSIIVWARFHRTHHKYTDTEADVSNSTRGFFFAHMGWIMLKPTALCRAKTKECNVDDLWADPIIKFQYHYYTSFCGNSVAHLWGTKPYDQTLSATHNDTLIYATLGGAYHNYHHVFPFDYSASELGPKSNFNLMTALIDFFGWIGWAYDMRRAPESVISNRKLRTGDKNGEHLRHPIIDWILGFIVTAAPALIISALKLIVIYKTIL